MKISDLPVLNDAKGNAYIPVVDPDESDPALRNKRIYLSTLSASFENFAPYDPAVTYSNTAPDYVSYLSNVYEYIAVTPAAGITPTNTSNWRVVSAGKFAHIQNTDLGTSNNSFIIQRNSQNQDPDGITVLGFGTQQGGKVMAIGAVWANDGSGGESYAFKVCYDYTGTGSDVWEELGEPTTDASLLTSGTLADARLTSNVPLLNNWNTFETTQEIMAATPADVALIIYSQLSTGADLNIYSDGKLVWSGTAEGIEDTNLYRADEALLQTDGKFNAANGLQHKGADLTAHKTGTVVDFAAVTTRFGSLTAAETGNITADLTGAVVLHTVVMFHNSGVEPTLTTSGVTFNKIGGTYQLGQTNRIYMTYVGDNTIDYSIR